MHTVLIIDDNTDDRLLCKRALGKAREDGDVRILEAGSGETGLESIAEHKPDCVLLDYSLPGRNGVEVLKRIRAKHPRLPVVMLTGQGNEAVAVQVMKEGGQDYITKADITAESLYRVVKLAVEHCRMQRLLDEQQMALSLFTHALAHDLKEPVRTIRSFLELMDAGAAFSDKQRGYYDRIRAAADNMSNLIDSVSVYTRLSDEQEISKTECDVGAVLENVVTNLNRQIVESGARVTHDPMPHVLAYEAHLMQVFQNLISNAIGHYVGVQAPEIHVGVSAQEGAYEFTVRDNGQGIPEALWDKAFEPFRRLSSRSRQGSGLGLAICKKIVERHGGTIRCSSAPGEGAVFVFTLPTDARRMPDARTGDAIGAAALRRAGEGSLANVLLVDDNAADVELTKILLMEKGKIEFNLYTAGDGRKAVDFLENSANPAIDLILLDVNMPRMDGFEFLQYRSEHAELQRCDVIMCSTSNYDRDIRKAKTLGAADYIHKPATPENIRKALEKTRGVVLARNGDSYRLLQAA